MAAYGIIGAAGIIGNCFWTFVLMSVFALIGVTSCIIFLKAGYHWALGLLMLVPLVNLGMLCFLAFNPWPIHHEIHKLRYAKMPPPPEELPREHFRTL